MRKCYNEMERELRRQAAQMRAEVNAMLEDFPKFKTEVVTFPFPCFASPKCNKSHKDDDLVIEDVKFAGPATIVFWNDGSKTVVKARNDEKFDKEKGLAMAIVKKVCGNNRDYYELFKNFCE